MEKEQRIMKIIKDYVTRCGGNIPLEILEEDYETSHGNNIPYKTFGYKNVIELLTAIPGISVKNSDGRIIVESMVKPKVRPNSETSNSLKYDDITSLCVKMDNNLLLECRGNKRKVMVKTENPVNVFRKNPVIRRYGSNSSCQSVENNYERNLSPASTTDQLRTYSVHSLCSNDHENSCYSVSPDLFDLSRYSNDGIHEQLSKNNYHWQESSDDYFANHLTMSPYSKNDEVSEMCYEERVPDEWLYDDYQVYEYNEEKSLITESELLNRIVHVINLKNQSTTSTEIKFRYFENYGVELPANWLILLEKSSLVYIENLSSDIIIYPNRSFLSVQTACELPKIEYPVTKTWNIYITAVMSTASISFRLRDNDYDSKFDILIHEMNKHYHGVETGKVSDVKREELYAVCMNANVVRVKVIKKYGDMVICLVIDFGIIRNFNIKCLFVLHEKFMNVCPLALQGSLTGLENYEKCHYINCKLRNLILNKNATASIEQFRENVLSLNLLVTSSSFSINVNRTLLSEIELNFSLPKFEVYQMYDVIILSVGEDIVRVQVISRCFNLLREILQKAKELIDADEKCEMYIKSVVDIQLNEMYIAKYTDGSWQRIIVQQFLSTREIVALFIDFQEIKTIDIRYVIKCSMLRDTLIFIPPQAIDVKVTKNDSAILNFLKQLYRTDLYSIKIMENSEPPLVEMFLKLPNTNLKPIANVLNMISMSSNVNHSSYYNQ